ncbi:MAG: diguanylate cyclase [Thermodesulfobacteriota bacterium]
MADEEQIVEELTACLVRQADVKQGQRREDAPASVRAQLDLWQATFDAIPDLIIVIDREFNIVLANKMARDLFPSQVILGVKCFSLFHNSDHPTANCPACKAFHSGRSHLVERQEPQLGGKWYRVAAHPLADAAGFVWHCVHIFRDISDERQLAERLEQLETQDIQTTLLNRGRFNELFSREFDLACRRYTDLVLLVIELDDFKAVNEECGLSFGDFILKEFAGELHSLVRENDLCARLGDERFAVVLPATRVAEGMSLARAIHGMAENHVYDNNAFCRQVTVSIGGASLQDHGPRTMDDLFFMAENSMRAAKRGGRNRIVFYDEDQLI